MLVAFPSILNSPVCLKIIYLSVFLPVTSLKFCEIQNKRQDKLEKKIGIVAIGNILYSPQEVPFTFCVFGWCRQVEISYTYKEKSSNVANKSGTPKYGILC